MALRRCSECGADVSSHATGCPLCGSPIRDNSGLLVKLFSYGCLLLIAAFWAAVIVFPDLRGAPPERAYAASTPGAGRGDGALAQVMGAAGQNLKSVFDETIEQVKKQLPEFAGKSDITPENVKESLAQLADFYTNTFDWVEAAGPPPRNAQKERENFINQALAQGVFSQVHVPYAVPFVHVNTPFYDLDTKQQNAYVKVVYEYFATLNASFTQVVLYDSLNRREIAQYTPDSGLRFK